MSYMEKGQLLRFLCIALLWLLLCYILLTSVREITGMTIFAIVASGIVVFVPLWKKSNKNKK